MHYDDTKSQTLYQGNAHVWQGQNAIIAANVTLGSNGCGSVSADGGVPAAGVTSTGVQSTFVLDKAPGSTTGTPPATRAAGCQVPNASCLNAQTMTYEDAKRVETNTTGATFIGTGAVAMSADSIALLLGSEGRTIDTVKADGTVIANFEGGRQAQGDHLVYTSGLSIYVVTGTPLVTVQRHLDSKAKESCQVQTGHQLIYTPAPDPSKDNGEFAVTDKLGRTYAKTTRSRAPPP